MTDKEIIVEVLEHCVGDDCGGCPNLATEYCATPKLLYKDIIALINRQQAEIERLQKLLDDKCDRCIARDRAEAIKEFAERLKEKKGIYNTFASERIIDNLVKEMVGEDK